MFHDGSYSGYASNSGGSKDLLAVLGVWEVIPDAGTKQPVGRSSNNTAYN